MRRTVVFDFDGTIADGKKAFLNMINDFSSEFGYDPIHEDQVEDLRKLGAKDFIVKRLKLPLWDLVKIEKRAREEYGKRMSEVPIFKGVKDVLIKLRDEKFRLGILSSNASEAINNFLTVNDAHHFDFIYSGSSLFGKSKVLKNMMKTEAVDLDDLIYIGDETRDIEACKKSSVPVIAVDWGFNDRESLLGYAPSAVASTPEGLLQEILALAE